MPVTNSKRSSFSFHKKQQQYNFKIFSTAFQMHGGFVINLWFADKSLLTTAVKNVAESCSDYWSLKILCTNIKTMLFLFRKSFPFLSLAS